MTEDDKQNLFFNEDFNDADMWIIPFKPHASTWT